jgi:hypothetical protein
MNSLLAAQPTSIIFDGTQATAKTGSGVYENNLSTADYITRFPLTSSTTIGRIVLDIKKYGTGADLTVEIRDNTFNYATGADGVLVKTLKFPAKMFTDGYVSLPVDLSGLTSDAYYWIRLVKAGDATNHLRWRGEAAADGNFPTYYRTGSTGAWMSSNAVHFYVYRNDPGNYLLTHGIYGGNGMTWVVYTGDGLISYVWRWLPSVDGTWEICEKLIPAYDANGVATKWEVA